MLPNKQYFHLTAIVPSHRLHDIMNMLGAAKAYNVEVHAYNFEEPGKKVKEKVNEKKRDLTEVKQAILDHLKKHSPSIAKDILNAVGYPGEYGILNRMRVAKQIKQAGKGRYKL